MADSRVVSLKKSISQMSKAEISAEAHRVLEVEAQGILALKENTGDVFASLVQRILGIEGRVIVSGMGKSGHISNKIAATLASTGTPAFFIHPGEASHGDLGAIAEGDLLFLLSNSGETSELADIIAYAKRYSIPLAGMTYRSESALAQEADFPICLTSYEEACPLGLAPTTSSTAMLAMGDALAVCLLKARGFTTQDFGRFHPGGKLGQRLMKVEELMDTGENMPLVQEDTLLGDVLLEMTKKAHGCTGVTNAAGELVGMITDGDLRRHMDETLMTKCAADIMTPDPMCLPEKMLVVEALALMNDKKITKIFVLNEKEQGQKPVGILNIHACLWAGIA